MSTPRHCSTVWAGRPMMLLDVVGRAVVAVFAMQPRHGRRCAAATCSGRPIGASTLRCQFVVGEVFADDRSSQRRGCTALPGRRCRALRGRSVRIRGRCDRRDHEGGRRRRARRRPRRSARCDRLRTAARAHRGRAWWAREVGEQRIVEESRWAHMDDRQARPVEHMLGQPVQPLVLGFTGARQRHLRHRHLRHVDDRVELAALQRHRSTLPRSPAGSPPTRSC